MRLDFCYEYCMSTIFKIYISNFKKIATFTRLVGFINNNLRLHLTFLKK